MSKLRIRVVSAAIKSQGHYLITQRNEHAVLPLLWEFPGGRVEQGETDEEALCRELHFRLGIEAVVQEKLTSTEREYKDYIVELHLYRCDLGPLQPQPLTVRDVRWVQADELDGYEFAPADQISMDALLFGGHPPH
jgi:8-oxo-dGTP diphosphatase